MSDINGRVIIDFEYEKIGFFSLMGPSAIVAGKNGKCGVIDLNNNVIIPFEYNLILPVANFFIVENVGLKGLLDCNGNTIIPIRCTEIIPPRAYFPIDFFWPTFKYCVDGKWGLYNNTDDVMVSAIYDDIPDNSFSCGRISVCKNGKWGFLNTKGLEVIPCIYDENPGTFFPNEPLRVSLNGEEFNINTKGDMV